MQHLNFYVAFTNDQEEHLFSQRQSLAEAREEAQSLFQDGMRDIDVFDDYDTHYALEAV